MMTHFLVWSTLALAPVLASQPQVQNEQIKFITTFYQGILDPDINRKLFTTNNHFFSKSLSGLMAKNEKICKEKSRGDDVCGYYAKGDIFLNTQEEGPGLNFDSSEFKAKSKAANVVEATFTVWPKEHDHYARRIQFKLIRENSSWRVDDMIYKLSPTLGAAKTKVSHFSEISMRAQIEAENNRYEKEAKNFRDTWFWVTTYINNVDVIERVSRFIHFPLTLCNNTGRCKTLHNDSEELKEAIMRLNEYYGIDGKSISKPKHLWPEIKSLKKAGRSPRIGQTIDIGPLKFVFSNDMWWLSQIDLSKIGKQ